LTLTGKVGNVVRWESNSGGGWTNISNTTTTLNYTGITTNIVQYRAWVVNGICTGVYSSIVLVARIPSPPSVFTSSTNLCGSKTLTRSNPPSGVTWYWQGTDQNGTSTANSSPTFQASTSGNYVLRAWNTVCWSSAQTLNVTVNDPLPPQDRSYTFCDFSNMVLTATSTTDNQWFNSTGSTLLATGPSYQVDLLPGTHIYKVKSVNSVGCVSSSFSTSSVTVNPNGVSTCDQKLNWAESVGYTIDVNGAPVVASSSRTFVNGHGETLQNQTKVLSKGNVLASQPVYDAFGNAVVNSLPAPINATQFVYRHKFMANPSGAKYDSEDFDLPTTTGAVGEVNNPAKVNSSLSGTLGWYYSSNNTLEPKVGITEYPFSRQHTPAGPNPLVSKSAGPGDAVRMGLGKEMKVERNLVSAKAIEHYHLLRPHFFIPTAGQSSALETVYSNTGNSVQDFSSWQTVSKSTVTNAGETYVRIQADANGQNSGVRPIGNLISVTPNFLYKLRVKGYRSSATNVALFVSSTCSGNLVWPGSSLPQGAANEAWVESEFTTPQVCGTISLGVLWPSSVTGDSFFINEIQLLRFTTESMVFKVVSTDPNGKQAVSYEDLEGRTLAKATLNGAVHDHWSYTYYNDLGQVVASVAPNGINLSSTAYPTFVTTYKYDHLGRLIESTNPDEGMSKFVYNDDGNLCFSENQEQRNASPKRFSYINYDYLGRKIETGEYTSTGSSPYVFQTHEVVSPSSNSVLLLTHLRGHTGVSRKLDASRCTEYVFVEYDKPSADLPTDDPLHAQQSYLSGNITKTENANGKTWYSYDEFGNVIWTKQVYFGPGAVLGAKTIDYTYNFLGSVTEVAYQKGKPDAFYHHYSYDQDQKLSVVETSLNGSSKSVRATYDYYLHGPVKRITLGNAVQGIDYTYTVDGKLKAINDGDPSRDPGLDGTAGPNVSVLKDAFGMTMQYYSGDYVAAGGGTPAQVFSGIQEQYGGMVKALSWHNATDGNQPAAYAFTYDNRYQLSEASFGTMGSNTFQPILTQPYKEMISAYDKNGNIQGLERKGKNGAAVGNYAYVYETNTNKVDRINTTAGGLLVDYEYNSLGQMKRQQEGSNIMNVAYNPSGLVKEVTNGTGQFIYSHAYDDRANRFLKVKYSNGNAVENQFYVFDYAGNVVAIYSQPLPSGVVTQSEVPIYTTTRIGLYKPMVSSVFYEVSDHLGNVRAVIGPPETRVYTATMESGNSSNEQPPFKNINERRVTFPTANTTPGGNAVVRVNNSAPIGPTLTLRVSPGDKLDMEVWAYYEGGSGYTNPINAAVMQAATALAFGGVSGAAGESGRIFNTVNNGLGILGFGGTSSNTVPAAYLQYMVYDNNDGYVFGGYWPISSAANFAKEKITIPQISINQPGYVYLFVYNRSDSPNWVYFDDMKVTHVGSPIVGGADYYSFGLPISDREILDEKYRYGYQGQFAEKEEVAGWFEFDLRMYDARFSRWISPDPYGQYYSPYLAMGNDPINLLDPDGGYSRPGAWWRNIWYGGDGIYQSGSEWGFNVGNGTFFEVGGEIVEGSTSMFGTFGEDKFKFSQDAQFILDNASRIWYHDNFEATERIVMEGGHGLEPVYPETWFMPVPKGLNGLGFSAKASKSLFVSSKIIQRGGNTISNSTLKAWKLTKEQGYKAIHAFKKEVGLGNKDHTNFHENGNISNSKGDVLGNIHDYVH
jgi:RHS repeat-associated protein